MHLRTFACLSSAPGPVLHASMRPHALAHNQITVMEPHTLPLLVRMRMFAHNAMWHVHAWPLLVSACPLCRAAVYTHEKLTMLMVCPGPSLGVIRAKSFGGTSPRRTMSPSSTMSGS